MFAVADGMYLYQVAQGTYTGGGVLDAGGRSRCSSEALLPGNGADRPEATARVENWMSIAFPIGFALVVIGVETYDHYHPVAVLALALSTERACSPCCSGSGSRSPRICGCRELA